MKKKITFALAFAALLATVGFAQVPVPANAATVTVEGKLALINGHIGVQSGGKTYYLGNVGRLAGFVDSFKEGATVKAVGYDYPIEVAPEYSRLMVTKLTVGGKDYDLSQGFGRGMGFGGGDCGVGAGRKGGSGRNGGGRKGW